MSGNRPPATIEAVLEALRRAQRQFAKNPTGAIEAAVKQLLAAGQARPAPRPVADSAKGASATYRIDELARVSGVTVRNIRSYQERGLLHAPERRGRIVLFDDSHVSRLKIVTSMLERGYSGSHILEMLHAWEQGRDLADVLGLEQALVPPDLADPAVTVALSEAVDRAGGSDELEQLVAAGLAEMKGSRVRLIRPKLVDSFGEMQAHGMSLEKLISVHLQVSEEIERITQVLVGAGFEQLAARFVEQMEGKADVEELVLLLTRFRTLALTSVTATLAASIERSIEGLLTDYLAEFLRAKATG